MARDSGKRIKEKITRWTKPLLETEDGSVFSRKEVRHTVRDTVGMFPDKQEDVLDAYENGSLDRRTFLKMFGFGLGGAVVASTGIGYFMGKEVFKTMRAERHGVTGYAIADAPGSTTVNLADEGLSPGDNITPYLDDHFTSGTKVIVSEGTYAYPEKFRGNGLKDASLLGDGMVALNQGDGENVGFAITRAQGDVLLRNFTFKNKIVKDTRGHHQFYAESNGTLTIENWVRPDGSEDFPAKAIGSTVDTDHAGEAFFKNWHIEGFNNNGLYATSPGIPGEGGGGVTHVRCSLFKNNNISQLRLGSTGSTAADCLIVVDKAPPVSYSSDSLAPRGLWLMDRAEGTDLHFKNIHINCLLDNKEEAQRPIILGSTGPSGVMEDIFVRNNTPFPCIVDKGGNTWSFSNVHLTGSGNLSTEISSDSDISISGLKKGGSAQEPETNTKDIGCDTRIDGLSSRTSQTKEEPC